MRRLVIFQVVLCLLAVQQTATAEIKIMGIVITQADTTIYNLLIKDMNGVVIAVRKEIFDKMVFTNNNETFAFTSLGHADKHFTVRENIVKAMNSMSANGGIDFSLGVGGNYTFADQLESTNAKENLYTFRRKTGTGLSASDVLKKVELGTTRSECVTACHCAILIGHRRTLGLGDAWIDGKFPAATFQIDGNLVAVTKTAVVPTIAIPGDFRYMKNKADYVEKAKQNNVPYPFLKGENTIYVGNGKYSGLTLLNKTSIQLRAELKMGYETDTGIPLSDPDANANITFGAPVRIKIH